MKSKYQPNDKTNPAYLFLLSQGESLPELEEKVRVLEEKLSKAENMRDCSFESWMETHKEAATVGFKRWERHQKRYANKMKKMGSYLPPKSANVHDIHDIDFRVHAIKNYSIGLPHYVAERIKEGPEYKQMHSSAINSAKYDAQELREELTLAREAVQEQKEYIKALNSYFEIED